MMEKKIYPDSFEQLLKAHADNFRMYPSRRVWHSIYNDLHPSRRWPSLVIWLFFIFVFFFLGVSNTNTVSTQVNSEYTAQLVSAEKSPDFPNSVSSKLHLHNLVEDHSDDGMKKTHTIGSEKLQNNLKKLPLIKKLVAKNNAIEKSDLLNNNNLNTIREQDPIVINLLQPSTETDNEYIPFNEIVEDQIVNLETNNDEKENKIIPVSATTVVDKNAEKEWMENFAFHNKSNINKWKQRTQYQFYFTPSIGYRMLTLNTKLNPIPMFSVSPVNSDIHFYKDAISHSAAVNIELGSNILYTVSKNLNIKAGIQFNYTNYRMNAYELKHPSITSLALVNPNNGMLELKSRSTNLANNPGVYNVNLNNNSYQFSLPIGADFRIAGNKNIKWYAGASIQPTYISGGNSYLLSSDLNYYVKDNSLMRSWNINAGLETFISYKTKSGVTVNAGPQVRYQILSTYSKQYTYDEKLYNMGVKIGITTRF